MWLNRYTDFINFAIKEMEKIGTMDKINIRGESGFLGSICFEVDFFGKGTFKGGVVVSEVSEDYKTTGRVYSDSEMEENFKKKLDEFVNRDKIIKELKDRKDDINKELNNIEKQLKEYGVE
jgi:hypothetical protein